MYLDQCIIWIAQSSDKNVLKLCLSRPFGGLLLWKTICNSMAGMKEKLGSALQKEDAKFCGGFVCNTMSGNRAIFFAQDGVKEPIAQGTRSEGRLISKMKNRAGKETEHLIFVARDCIGKQLRFCSELLLWKTMKLALRLQKETD